MNNKSILITGGTGSFGNRFIEKIIKNKIKPKKLIIFSRDELKQHNMAKKFSPKKYKFLRYFIGDIRDKNRLKFAFKDVNIIIHAAALKQVPIAEYNPFEYVNTNVIGAQNIVEACLENKSIENVVGLSTDKAVSAINLYGATKLCLEKIFIAANNVKGKQNIKFSIARYGNVFGSRGSIIPYLKENEKKDTIDITDKSMTRFNITLDESVDFVFWILKNNFGGEIFVPKLPSYRILDLVKAICPNKKIKYIGIRPGEKMHESMISQSDAPFCLDINKHYVVLQNGNNELYKKYLKAKAKKVSNNFSYSSDKNNHFMKIKEINKLYEKEFSNSN